MKESVRFLLTPASNRLQCHFIQLPKVSMVTLLLSKSQDNSYRDSSFLASARSSAGKRNSDGQGAPPPSL